MSDVGSALAALDVDDAIAQIGELAVDACECGLVPRGVAGALVGVVPSYPDHLVTPETAAATASGNPSDRQEHRLVAHRSISRCAGQVAQLSRQRGPGWTG